MYLQIVIEGKIKKIKQNKLCIYILFSIFFINIEIKENNKCEGESLCVLGAFAKAIKLHVLTIERNKKEMLQKGRKYSLLKQETA